MENNKMDYFWLDEVKDMLIRDEGFLLKPYMDSVGVLTIGVGRNLKDNGISKKEAEVMLHNDIMKAMEGLIKIFGEDFLDNISKARQMALVNMMFNLGETRFRQFKRMISAIKDNDWEQAATEAMDSFWAKQVKSRAVRICALLKDGDI